MTISRRNVLFGAAASASLAAFGGPLALTNPKSGAARAWRLPDKQSFKVIENEWIPMQDGVRLAARIWMPAQAESHAGGVGVPSLPPMG
jgi:predicted acyl esterase